MESECGRDVYWEVFDASGNKLGQIPPVPGPLKRGFGIAVLDGGKIVFIGGYTEVEGSGINSTTVSASADVYEFDPAANRSPISISISISLSLIPTHSDQM